MIHLITFLIGLSLVAGGWAIGGIEIYHLAHEVHRFDSVPFLFSGILITGGAGLIQTQSVKETITLITVFLPSWRRNVKTSSEYQSSSQEFKAQTGSLTQADQTRQQAVVENRQHDSTLGA